MHVNRYLDLHCSFYVRIVYGPYVVNCHVYIFVGVNFSSVTMVDTPLPMHYQVFPISGKLDNFYFIIKMRQTMDNDVNSLKFKLPVERS